MNQKNLFYTPSKLVRFFENPFASRMDRHALHFPQIALEKNPEDPLLRSLQERGFAYEESRENKWREQGLIIQKPKDFEETLSAMKRGVELIVQAPLEIDQFQGTADFLKKIEGQSRLGNYHYEVWDTKLSKHLKPAYAIQLCCYAEMLEAIQGVRPRNITLALGDGTEHVLRTNDYFPFYLQLKKAFLNEQESFDPSARPDPADFKCWGDWSNYAETALQERDHLIQVAHITRGQIKKLNQQNIHTMQQLATTPLSYVSGVNLVPLKKQAAMQKASATSLRPLYEVIVPPSGEKQGLAMLPPASPLDVFFDIEGFPLYDGGLEYLWGCTYFTNTSERHFKDFWAHDREQEKEAFRRFILWVYERWQKDPSMHIYHYAHYEITVCRKLMGRFGVCEEEVDQLLRNEVFVDLYKIVKGGLIVGEPSYSIKNIERLYREKRQTDVGSGSESVVAYESWRTHPDGATWKDSQILKNLRDYNKDDCESTEELATWLRERQQEHKIAFIGKSPEEHKEEKSTEIQEFRDRLLEKAKQSPNRNLLENLAWMLEFHARESKPIYWRYFDRQGLSPEELFDDPDCLALCQRTSRASFKATPKKFAYEYRFDPKQEFRGASKKFRDLGSSLSLDYVEEESDLENGFIVLKSSEEPKSLISLIPFEIVNAKPLSEAIFRFVSDYDSGKLSRSAALDFLNRLPPSIKGHTGGPIITTDDPAEKLQQIIQAVENLDHSYLTIQGPPGSGKTYTASRVIAHLLQKGCKIGISSNSHKAINNLLFSTVKLCQQQNIVATFASTQDPEPGIHLTKNPELHKYLSAPCLLGTTAWGFARPEFAAQLDYLFIDEAGQVSTANLIAMSRSAKNLVLLGDQMQLPQPTQGSHPEESGLSILDYLLHNTPTISPEMGIFLDTTYRLHPAINSFISEHIYEDKLTPHPSTALRTLKLPPTPGKITKEAGILFIPTPHQGNTQASDEEVAEICQLTKELLTYSLLQNGTERPLTLRDFLFIAPYNYQCHKLQEALGPHARVGSVDKLQGQEAPIVFLSMCASDATESPRGLEFLLNKNRINVALSRAQTLAIVVGNPELASGGVSGLGGLRAVGLFGALLK